MTRGQSSKTKSESVDNSVPNSDGSALGTSSFDVGSPTESTTAKEINTKNQKKVEVISANKNSFVVRFPEPDPKNDNDAVRFLKSNAYFDRFGSVIIIGGWVNLLEELLESKNIVEEYNKKAKDMGITFHIRWANSVSINKKNYLYCGGYIYNYENGKEVYKGKYDAPTWRKMIGSEAFLKLGPMPQLKIDNIKFFRVPFRLPKEGEERDYEKEKELESVVMPNQQYFKLKRFFDNCQVLSLG